MRICPVTPTELPNVFPMSIKSKPVIIEAGCDEKDANDKVNRVTLFFNVEFCLELLSLIECTVNNVIVIIIYIHLP